MDYNKQTLYLIRGVSGSGKSTFAQHLVDSGVVSYKFEADDYFLDEEDNYNFDAEKLHLAHKQCQEETEWALGNGRDVVVSNTSTTEKEVKIYQDIAEKTNSNFVSIIVENRNDTESVHGVPDDVLERQRVRFSVKL